MKSNRIKVAGLGEMLWDMFDDHSALGGAPANCSCHCSILDAEAYMIICVGNDELGRNGRAFLNDRGVYTMGIAVSKTYETGIVNVELDSEGKPEYEIKENVAWDHIPFTDEIGILASQLDAVCFGTLAQRSRVSKQSIERILDATSRDCLRMFDINIRQDYYFVVTAL